MSHAVVPLLVQVVSGNPATSAGVLLCLNTYDATNLRRVHPVLLHTVADVPWCDTATAVRYVRRWRAALPAAVGARVTRLRSLDYFAPLVGLTWVDFERCSAVNDVVVHCLPFTLRRLVVRRCVNLTHVARFAHLPSLTSLDCSYTAALDAGLEALPASLQELRMDGRGSSPVALPAANFHRLRALRVLSWTLGGASPASIATLPPTLEELDIADSGMASGTASLTHLPRLRVVRASSTFISDATVAALPAFLVELDIWRCGAVTPAVSFAHLCTLQTLRAHGTDIGDTTLASLPPSLVSLNVSECKRLSLHTTLPGLPSLQVLDVSSTSVGNALVASLPPCLITLRLTNCENVTRAADLHHLPALRELQSSGTNLRRSALVALRARGCFAPAERVKRSDSGYPVHSMVVLANGRIATGDRGGVVRLLDPARKQAVAASSMGLGVWVANLVVLPDGRRLAVATCTTDTDRGAGSVEVWDTHNTSLTQCSTIAFESGVRALAVLHGGRLAVGCASGRIRLVDVDTVTYVSSAPTLRHSKCVAALVVLPDGTLASGSHDNTVRVWDVGSGVCVSLLEGHTGCIHALAVLASGHLASASNDCTVRLWDTTTRTCYAVLASEVTHGCQTTIYAMAALPDGRLVCSGSEGVVRVRDTHAWLPLRDGDGGANRCCRQSVMLEGYPNYAQINAVSLLPDGRVASVGSGTIRLWRLPPLPVPVLPTGSAEYR